MPALSFSAIPIGIRYMLLSAFGFALMSACVKYVSLNGIPVFEIVASRALVSLIISYTDVRRKGLSPLGNNKPLLLLRGVLGTMALMCVYYAVTTLPLAEATVLQYTHPVFTAILGLVLLKERLQGATLVCIALCLTGLYIMVQPNLNASIDDALPTFSVVVALMGALGSSIAYVIVRKLSRTEDSSVIILYFPMVALPVATVLMWPSFVLPSLSLTLLLVLVGVFTQVGQYGLTKAMQTQQAGQASAYAYIQIVFSTLIGVWIFNEVPSIWTYIGGGLIVTGAVFNAMGHRLFRRRASA
ncbi:DMT family transporter [Salinivibrio kushneri]|uniref:DMT family transporter n=1 Tax=Salinivibrio kushneri TaxID=1908198 RepID=UPI0009885139|nr:DMT family transporter [Salinivibrio kushneri]OOE32304.1 EamA family transporter [Salinivibrio kushneri]OOE45656.1 EamA family transporter [Salinivibrio kushneri]OOE53298.1 EamA family transporter [Salinivibrio kushneri]